MTIALDIDTTPTDSIDDLDEPVWSDPDTPVPPAVAKLAALLAQSYAVTPLFI